MFLKAGALALALLLASRVLGLLRETALAAAFGASALADVAVLMLTLPDWIAGLLASGALAYVLLPAWAGQGRVQVQALQRKVARRLLAAGCALAAATLVLCEPLVALLVPGLEGQSRTLAAEGLVWSALALPAALLAALWVTRLQHERDVAGMYAANLVVNAVVIAAIALAMLALPAVTVLGLGLLAAMGLRLAWLRWRQRPLAAAAVAGTAQDLPAARVWLWAALSAGLPLALPFVARSAASQSGAGALATFNYAWKLVELPLVLAIQLVAALAFPAIARSFARGAHADAASADALNGAFALAWTLACAAAAALLVGSPALAQLLFGWGRMDPQALETVARWAAAAAWGLLPQALVAVALTVLAAQSRLAPAVAAHAVALAVLVAAAAAGVSDGLRLMQLLNLLYAAVALVTVAVLGRRLLLDLPWRAFASSLAGLLVAAWTAMAAQHSLQGLGMAAGLALALLAALLVVALAWLASPLLRQALRR
jgi:peptidoglycan biosynthesis protein MviN/MurJ (putative lipid II flippase)